MTVFIPRPDPSWLFEYGDHVAKRSGAEWSGIVCGYYTTELTPRGYAVESEHHANSVQIYPEAALVHVPSVALEDAQ